MSEQTNWLDDIHESCDTLREVANCLAHVSGCLYTAGNTRLSNDLDRWSIKVYAARNTIRQAAGAATSEMLKNAQEATGSVVLAALNGIKLAQEEDE